MESLFVSDLDGTLLRSDGTLSDYSRSTLTKLLQSGLHFTVASARAWSEIVPVLGNLPLSLPVIAVNGAFLTDYHTGRHLVINNIAKDFAEAIYQHILDHRLQPFIVTHNGSEDCLYWQDLKNEQMQWYHDMLHVQKDKRIRRISDLKHALAEQVIAFAVMGPPDEVRALAEYLDAEYPGLLENYLFENFYTPGHWWLTIHDQKACKSKAIRTLSEISGYSLDSITVFGDHINDIKMFQTAGRAVAVANAQDQLKRWAHLVIAANDEDAVVRYLASCMPLK